LLKRLPAGLRAEVWLGLPPGAASLRQLVAIKAYFPHPPGRARSELATELALAPRLTHANIVRTLRIGRDGERPFSVSEYIEGTTLRALLRRANVARARLAPAAVARLLLGIVRAVSHAEGRATSPAAKALARQMVAADDVFVTFDGVVKLLGFKAWLAGAQHSSLGSKAQRQGPSAQAAIDALLAQHLTPELRAVLASSRAPARAPDGLRRIEQGLDRWRAEVLRSDGRAELAALTGAMFPSARLDQRAQLEVCLEEWSSARAAGTAALPIDNGAPPASGLRTIGR
jgi:hypothetical protein